MNLQIKKPESPEEWEAYYRIRFEVLRKPWNQPESSTRDETEKSSSHYLLIKDGAYAGTGRLQFNSASEAQIRSMAILESARSKGLGSWLMKELEAEARRMGRTEIVLDARENAVPFYQKNGYTVIASSYLLFNTIQHFKMSKTLAPASEK